ncbi:MAG: hypothetical protein AB1758_35705, partial [Candidatus Eremiobacterota bacterium]
ASSLTVGSSVSVRIRTGQQLRVISRENGHTTLGSYAGVYVVPDQVALSWNDGVPVLLASERDMDLDGVADRNDPDRDGDGIADVNDKDRDNDGVRDSKDGDLDNDGLADEAPTTEAARDGEK